MSALKGYRTLLFNGVAVGVAGIDALIPVVNDLLNRPELQGLIPDKYMPAYALVVGVVNIYLRTRTNTPVGRKRPY